MNKQIKLDIDSLCIYKKVFTNGVGGKLAKLINDIESDCSLSDSLKDYNELTYELFNANKDLSFREYIVDEMLLDHNPYNVGLEVRGELPSFIDNGVRNELKVLSEIVKVNSKVIKEIMKEKYSDISSDVERIDSLIDWGINEKKYVAKTQMPYELIKEKLMNSSDWTECLRDLSKFHRENGTGRAPAYSAFVWERFENEEEGHLREITNPDPIRLSELIGYEEQKKDIINNTVNFINGIPSNNLLLYGSRGTGKSSTVKAILNEYYDKGLRLIEVDKEQLSDFTRIIRLLRHKKQKFIIFVDDLVFEENEASYSALKTILEGRIENRPSNILIYATTNRRHLIKEKFSDRDEVHGRDTQEEQLSLADRFGITISFFAPNQKEFLKIVDGLAESRKLDVDVETLHSEALKWEKWYNGRSPRSARQFLDWYQGQLASK